MQDKHRNKHSQCEHMRRDKNSIRKPKNRALIAHFTRPRRRRHTCDCGRRSVGVVLSLDVVFCLSLRSLAMRRIILRGRSPREKAPERRWSLLSRDRSKSGCGSERSSSACWSCYDLVYVRSRRVSRSRSGSRSSGVSESSSSSTCWCCYN
jgi:hypothetical protein